jgi:2-methylcitrate dehydratase PrpD
LGIAGSLASGTTEYARSGGEVKRVHAGFGAAGGIRAARLARAGITAPHTIYEGPRGFLQAFAGSFDTTPLADGLGERWHFLERAALKPWACCALNHACYAALDRALAGKNVQASDVEWIELGVDHLTLSHTGSIGPYPNELIEAQFSAEFGTALRVVSGDNSITDYIDAERHRFNPPNVRTVAEKVRLVVDQECESVWPGRWLGRTTIGLRGGTTLSATAEAPGTPNDPLSASQVEDKFRRTTHGVLEPAAQSRLISLIADFENLPSLMPVGQALGTARRR